MAGGEMARCDEGIPQSAKYTAATWRWGELPCADLTVPDGAAGLFRTVNAYMALYRLINPAKHSLHHTLLHRHAMINRLLLRQEFEQVIEIAAGFSPRGAKVSEEPAVDYFEVDLEAVVRSKTAQLQRTSAGRSILERQNFHQVVGDILHLDFTSDFPARKSLVITEGLMMYFSRDEQLRIWSAIASLVTRHHGRYVFDYIPLDIEPPRSVAGRLLHRFKQRLGGDALGFCYDRRDRREIRRDLLSAGFETVAIHDSSEVAGQWRLPFPGVRTQVLVYECG